MSIYEQNQRKLQTAHIVLVSVNVYRNGKDYRAGEARKMGSSAHKLKRCGRCCHLAAGVFKHVRTAAEAIN